MRKIIFLFLLTTYVVYPCEEVSFSCADGGKYPIHLTFDDGPHDYNTGRILDILKDEKVPATFFLQVMKLVDEQGYQINYSGRRDDLAAKGIPNYYYYLMDRMKKEGHSVGSHAYEHLHHVDSYFAREKWRENLQKGNPDILREYFEHRSNALIRLPHGQGWFEQTSKNPEKKKVAEEIMDELEMLGMVHVGWNIDSLDWRYDSVDLSYKNLDDEVENFPSTLAMNTHYQQSIVDQICQHGGGIVLMHDAKEINWKNLRCLVQGLKKEGHHFVRPEDFIGFERSWGAPLIGRMSMDQSLCCSFFDSTTSPIESERLAQFENFIQYIVKKYSD